MDIDSAMKIARTELVNEITLTYHEKPDVALYGFDPDKEYLFSYSLNEAFHVGGSNYVGVNKETGDVSILGYGGE